MKITVALPFVFIFSMNFLQAQSTLDKIQGDWTCIINVRDMSMLNTDESYPNDEKALTPFGNLRIEKDQLSKFDYPCEYLFTSPINFNNDTLIFSHHDGYSIYTYSLDYSNDTLTLRFFRDFYATKSYQTYIRDTFDNAVINTLKKDSIYPQSLKQTWYLRKGYDSGYDGLGYVTFEFPYKIPDSLVITKNNLNSFSISGRKIHIPVNGVERTFYIERFSLKEDELVLKEYGKWYVPKKDKDFNYRISYELELDD